MRVLGIDPGTIELGWGLMEVGSGGALRVLDHGSLKVSSSKVFLLRIGEMAEQFSVLLDSAQPDQAVIEKIFLGKNVDSAFKLGHVRGACVAECQRREMKVFEYSPRTVKKHITGSGSAGKDLVRNLLYRQLGLKEDPRKSLDASDALALAFSHIMQDSVAARLRKAEL